MLAMFFLMIGMYFSSMLSHHASFEMKFAARQATPLATSLIFYHNEATAMCYDSSTSRITCDPGIINMPSRWGVDSAMYYGKTFISFTDGKNYIGTAFTGPRVAGVNVSQGGVAWLYDSLNRQMQYSVTLGKYSAATSSVVFINTGSAGYSQRKFILPMPITVYDGAPVIIDDYTHSGIIDSAPITP